MLTTELIVVGCLAIISAIAMGFHFGHLCGRYSMNAKAARCLVSAARYRIAYLTLALDHLPPHLTAQECIDGIEEAHQIITRMDGLSE